MGKRFRRKYFVDRAVQGALVSRIARYWLMSLVAIGCLSTLGWLFVYPGVDGFIGAGAQMATIFPIFFVAVVVALMLLPLILIDLIRLTNKFAGPMFRLLRVMQLLADGKSVDPIFFRDGDYWHEFADAFNRIAARLHDEQPSQNPLSDEVDAAQTDSESSPNAASVSLVS